MNLRIFIKQYFLEHFLQSLSHRDLSTEEDLMKFAVPGEKCLRPCVEGDQNVCHFEFRLEHYQVLGGFVK